MDGLKNTLGDTSPDERCSAGHPKRRGGGGGDDVAVVLPAPQPTTEAVASRWKTLINAIITFMWCLEQMCQMTG